MSSTPRNAPTFPGFWWFVAPNKAICIAEVIEHEFHSGETTLVATVPGDSSKYTLDYSDFAQWLSPAMYIPLNNNESVRQFEKFLSVVERTQAIFDQVNQLGTPPKN